MAAAQRREAQRKQLLEFKRKNKKSFLNGSGSAVDQSQSSQPQELEQQQNGVEIFVADPSS